jgi:uncharacterized protein YbjQ (UPF0145 family)
LEALLIGGEAIIGVDLDFSQMSGGSNDLVVVSANGTAVALD